MDYPIVWCCFGFFFLIWQSQPWWYWAISHGYLYITPGTHCVLYIPNTCQALINTSTKRCAYPKTQCRVPGYTHLFVKMFTEAWHALKECTERSYLVTQRVRTSCNGLRNKESSREYRNETVRCGEAIEEVQAVLLLLTKLTFVDQCPCVSNQE